MLINGREKVGTKDLKSPKAFIDYSQTTDDVYENLETYNPTKKRCFNRVDDMIADMESNKKLSPIVTELYLRGRKLNVPLFVISQSYLKVPKTIRLNKCNTLFYHETSYKKRTSTSSIKSFL